MKGQLRIDTLYAFIVLDDDGTEGVPAIMAPSSVIGMPMMVPLMGADTARIESLREVVMHDPALHGKKVTLAQFTNRKVIEVIQR
jgi:hypothetical protein